MMLLNADSHSCQAERDEVGTADGLVESRLHRRFAGPPPPADPLPPSGLTQPGPTKYCHMTVSRDGR